MDIAELKKIVSDISENEPMDRHTTFRVGGPADVFARPSVKELIPLIAYLRDSDIPYTVIGNGSNLLVGDGGIRGVVVYIGEAMADISVDGEISLIRAGAGALLSKVSAAAAAHGLSGLEFASGIPGSIGGGIAMNAGAYGGEMRDVAVSVSVLHDGSIVEYDCSEMDFSYRHSRVLGTDDIVTEVCLKLTPGIPEDIRATMAELNGKRAEKQPINLPSAGSTFKRPEGYFAGKLIEDAGLRGYRVGGACVSTKHCGFVVNDDHSTAADIKRLISDIQERVFSDSGVHLETEVRMIGEF